MSKAGKDSAGTVTIERFGSGIGRPKVQKDTLVGLGLAKKRRIVRKDTPEIRGMVAKISHLVRIVES